MSLKHFHRCPICDARVACIAVECLKAETKDAELICEKCARAKVLVNTTEPALKLVRACPLVHPNGEQCILDFGHEGNHRLPDGHRCHARGCSEKIPPEMLMCRKHWFRVPRMIQRAVYAAYRPGQCDDMSPSKDWHEAADAAIGYVATLDDQPLRVSEVNALKEYGYSVRESGGGLVAEKI